MYWCRSQIWEASRPPTQLLSCYRIWPLINRRPFEAVPGQRQFSGWLRRAALVACRRLGLDRAQETTKLTATTPMRGPTQESI